jgi:PAS domain S-box-containing protein/putative nucleotidyltransferase with HDIG domain
MRIFVVDDSDDNLNFFKSLFESKNYKVTTAVNGEDALKKLRTLRADVIISDIVMPVMDGFLFLQECKSDEKLGTIPFILITGAFLDDKDESLAKKMGVNAFIRKPIEADRLLETVENVLEQSKTKKKGRKPKTPKDVLAKQYTINLAAKLEARMKDLEREIKERQDAEKTADENQRRFQILFETMESGAICIDSAGMVQLANQSAEMILGLKQEYLIGRPFPIQQLRVMREDNSSLPKFEFPAYIALKTGKPVKDVTIGISNQIDRKVHWIRVSATPQFQDSEDKPYQVFTTFEDITDRFLTFKALQENESRLNAVIENTRDLILSVDNELQLISANEAARKLYFQVFGVPLQQSMNIVELMPQERQDFWLDLFSRVLKGEHEVFGQHYDLQTGFIDLEMSVNPIISALGRVTGISLYGRDITIRKINEEALEKNNRLYKTLFMCNEAIVLATDEIQLMHDICRVLVETGKYKMAWVGYAESDERKTVHPVAYYGLDKGYLSSLNVTWDEETSGRGPTGKAIRSGNTQACLDVNTDPDYLPWRQTANTYGYVSTISLPLKSFKKVIGALNLYSSTINIFNDDEIKLLEQLASDVTFGITSLREHLEREETEAALMESEEKYRILFENAGEGIIVTQDDVIKFYNPKALEFFGHPPDELNGWSFFKDVHPDDLKMMKERHEAILRGDAVEEIFSFRSVNSNGDIRWVEIHPVSVTWEGRTAVLTFFNDVTARRKSEEAVKNSEEKYRLLFENSGECILITQDHVIKFFNPKAIEFFGYSPDELHDMPFIKVVHPDDAQMIMDINSARTRGEDIPPKYSFRAVLKDGSTRWIERHAAVINWEGKPAYLSFFSDITDRKTAEDALRESEDKFHRIYDQSPVGIALISLDNYRLLAANAALCAFLGYTEEELQKTSFADTTHEDYVSTDLEIINKLISGETDQYIADKRYIRKDGSEIWGHVIRSLVRDSDGRPLYFLPMIQDITERKKAEEELNLRALLLDKATDAITVHDLEGNILYINEAVSSHSGYDKAEFMKMNLNDIDVPIDNISVAERYRLAETKGPLVFETTHRRKDGSLALVEIHSHIIEYSGKKYLLSISHDITQRKKDEAELNLRALLLDKATDAILVHDSEGNLIYANESAYAPLGYEKAEYMATNLRNIDVPEDDISTAKRFKLSEEQGPLIFKSRVRRKDGGLIDVEAHSQIIEMKGNKYMLTVGHDISQREKDQAELNLRAYMLDVVSDSILMHDFYGKIIYANETAVKSLGYTKEEMMALNLSDIDVPVDDLTFEERDKQISSKGALTFETSFRRKDGTIFDVEASIHVLEFNGNKFMLGINHDITKRKQDEMALKESLEHYRRIAENAPELIFRFRLKPALHFEYVSPVSTKIVGYTPEEHYADPFLGKKYTHPDDYPKIIPHFEGNSNYDEPITVRWIHKNGRLLYVEIITVPIYDEAGDIMELESIARDITDRKKAEEDLKIALEKITSTLEGTIDAIAMMSELRDPYTAGHQRMVAKLAIAIAREIGLSDDKIHGLRVAGLLHDVGKVNVPSEILSKPGKLSQLEMGLAKAHAQAGYEIVKTIKFPWPVDTIIHQHHERVNGSGYPKGLQGDQIMLEARILSVADVVEAMMSHRPYRPSLGLDKALEEITTNRGTLYDPQVVDACVRLFREKGFAFQDQSLTN